MHDGRDSLQNLGVDRRITVKWVVKKQAVSMQAAQGTVLTVLFTGIIVVLNVV